MEFKYISFDRPLDLEKQGALKRVGMERHIEQYKSETKTRYSISISEKYCLSFVFPTFLLSYGL